ncbi:SDR family NAD(P)-dependent oxidoreductase [Tunicatimonas pelagia]|uniref:SDR family NAD(P)-dependent oxidoreductase n=1 Tax=Tunicatimonas pelagia TaxID=931531 RepID=UPI0026666412|nr:SDR family oxidoreductase [Tunicatimonas pelagia]WKN40967.1 SDR family NAD(P)-dependent oxidoreductase [Tunicatimonas pelagia]
MMELLENKVAAVFAANGAIAREVSFALAQNGATVHLSGRNLAAVKQLATEINQVGGTAIAHQVDATNESEIDAFLTKVVAETGQLDIAFNGIGLRAHELQLGTPSTELPFEKFKEALEVSLGSQFLTSRAAAKHMIAAKSAGTIITLSASLSRIKMPFMAGITAACAGIEGMTRVLAAEFGRAGIKVTCLNATALVDTRTIQETQQLNAKTIGISAQALGEQMKQGYLLGKSPSAKDIGKLAVFLATDTGALLNSHVIDADFGVHSVI